MSFTQNKRQNILCVYICVYKCILKMCRVCLLSKKSFLCEEGRGSGMGEQSWEAGNPGQRAL